MISAKTITGASWVEITTAGQSGVCWIDEDETDHSGAVDCRVWHGTSAPDDDDLVGAKKVFKPNSNRDFMLLNADNASDVFYARCKNTGDQATLMVDVI